MRGLVWLALGCHRPTPPPSPVAAPQLAEPGGVSDLALGDDHGCAVVAGRVACWGDGARGQLGPTATESTSARWVEGLPSDVVQVEAAQATTCARTRAGEVWCWGGNDDRQVQAHPGDARWPARLEVPAADDVVAGGATVCARTAESWWCNGGYRAVVDARPGGERLALEPAPEPVLGDVSTIALGTSDCVLHGGDAWCWGAGPMDAPTGIEVAPAPWAGGPARALRVPGPVSAVATRGSRVAFATVDGVVIRSALASEAREIPWSGVVEIGLGGGGGCLRHVGGRVGCWTSDRPIEEVLAGASKLAVGDETACAVTASGVLCWGADARGQAGDGGESAWMPRSVGVRGGALAITRRTTCVEGDAGWRCGSGGAWTPGAPPTLPPPRGCAEVAGALSCEGGFPPDLVDVAGDVGGVLALDADGVAWCRGASVGCGAREMAKTAVRVEGLPPLASVHLTGDVSAGVDRDGQLWVWGFHLFEEGEVSTEAIVRGVEPRPPISVGPARSVSGAHGALCWIDGEGLVRCLGRSDHGTLGRRAVETRKGASIVVTTEAGEPLRASAVAVGGSHACALVDGELVCWGAPEAQPVPAATAAHPVKVALPDPANR